MGTSNIKKTIHGVLLVNKPRGLTSHDVVLRVRELLAQPQVGHCGTLDPQADGLLVLVLGQGTKIAPYLTQADKHYRGYLYFGLETDTGDRDGRVLRQENLAAPHSKAGLVEAIESVQGELELPVPRYSAVQVQGERLYEKARRGEEFSVPVRRMYFYDVKVHLEGWDWPRVPFELKCRKGSYVRSWVQAVSQQLGSPITLDQLTRLGSGHFHYQQAATLEMMAQWMDQQIAVERWLNFVTLHEALRDWFPLRVTSPVAAQLRQGQIARPLKTQLVQLWNPFDWPYKGFKILTDEEGDHHRLVALIGVEPQKGFFIQRGFVYS